MDFALGFFPKALAVFHVNRYFSVTFFPAGICRRISLPAFSNVLISVGTNFPNKTNVVPVHG
jgi:hypothetical protein